MPRKTKFRKGPKITSAKQFAAAYNRGAWIYLHHKPYHFGWYGAWPYRNVAHAIQLGLLYLAVKNK